MARLLARAMPVRATLDPDKESLRHERNRAAFATGYGHSTSLAS